MTIRNLTVRRTPDVDFARRWTDDPAYAFEGWEPGMRARAKRTTGLTRGTAGREVLITHVPRHVDDHGNPHPRHVFCVFLDKNGRRTGRTTVLHVQHLRRLTEQQTEIDLR